MDGFSLTVFEKDGSILLNESFEANHEKEAMELCKDRLEETGYSNQTHRFVSPDGKLLLFHR
ncbi:hypothetical protein NC661_07260 [Aquibacillus koreensis]|uniref:YhzD-like protein n=1 Tax=Aquibacillus koreensis TaxID=279446 RepID=A0A9X3WMR9_9BACI|nr:YhzD family protein [Aquibacillus koreensis]MCT2535549.1 YhzD family protein [Aquibacillus koreensis]MDC3420166.1 hypothetical protein [Aquibacillus koreensis]